MQIVSVIILDYNHPKYLGEATQICLDQTHIINEIIVIDDG